MITRAVTEGISFLRSQQQSDGSFLSLSFSTSELFADVSTYHSVFSTTLILSCLHNLEETEELKEIKQKAVAFLMTQKSEHWSFNYWVRGSKESQKMPYPDDLDDTFCALAALLRYEPHLFEGKALAAIVGILTMLELKEGGPYRTWLVGEAASTVWKDVDVAVNSNIAYFLSLLEIKVPNLTKYLEKAIKQDALASPYYYLDYPIIYFLSRFYKGKQVRKLKQMLLSKKMKTNRWSNPLHTALAISSLLNLGEPASEFEQAIAYLLEEQKDGHWEPHAFYFAPVREGRTYFAGSSVLTTAFCLEALTLYKKAQGFTGSVDEKTREAQLLHNKVVKQVQSRWASLPSVMKFHADKALERVLKNDVKKEVTLMPYFFAQALGKKAEHLSDDFLVSLGAANVYGWIAYTLYDDFLDGEGDPKALPLANSALREVTALFYDLSVKKPVFLKQFHAVMDELDAANAWEVEYCRIAPGVSLADVKIPDFKNYQKLAQKSLGHMLGPLAILYALAYDEKSSQVEHFMRFFSHYLIARQLNDDAHDWQEDLKKGYITPIIALLLQQYKNKYGKADVRLDTVLPELRQLFWYEVITDVCSAILTQVKKARKQLQVCALFESTALFEKLLDRLEYAADLALSERKETLAFIDSYTAR